MTYAITYLPVAEAELAAVWLASADRSGITAAADWLDRELGRNPLRLGESRESPLRRLPYRDGLGVEYEVIPDDRRVVVQGVFAAG